MSLTPIPGQPAFYPEQPTTTPTEPGGYAQWQAGLQDGLARITAALLGGKSKTQQAEDDGYQDAQQDEEEGW